VKLNPGERSILAGFFQRTDAEAAQAALKQAGFAIAQIDRVSEHGTETGADTRRPAIGGGATSLAGSVLYAKDGLLDEDARVIMAAMPDVSGMAGEVRQEAPYLLTVVTHGDRVEEARSIIQHHRGKA